MRCTNASRHNIPFVAEPCQGVIFGTAQFIFGSVIFKIGLPAAFIFVLSDIIGDTVTFFILSSKRFAPPMRSVTEQVGGQTFLLMAKYRYCAGKTVRQRLGREKTSFIRSRPQDFVSRSLLHFESHFSYCPSLSVPKEFRIPPLLLVLFPKTETSPVFIRSLKAIRRLLLA